MIIKPDMPNTPSRALILVALLFATRGRAQQKWRRTTTTAEPC